MEEKLMKVIKDNYDKLPDEHKKKIDPLIALVNNKPKSTEEAIKQQQEAMSIMKNMG